MIVSIKKAVEIINLKGIVAIPTETVYGLAADATSTEAVEKIFLAKKRPSYNPLIIHVASLAQAMEYAEFNDVALKIVKKFWPGPITLVLPKKQSKISNLVTASLDSIAIRFPDHAVMREVILTSGKVLAAPSANLSGSVSPTAKEHVIKNFADKIPVIDGEKSVYGLESTIIDCTSKPAILRHGFITKELLSDFLEMEIDEASHSDSIKAPGMLKKHYSPSSKLQINMLQSSNTEVAINFGKSDLQGFITFNLSKSGNLAEAASNLYDFLYKADEIVSSKKLHAISVAPIPNEGLGIAINDKLERANQ